MIIIHLRILPVVGGDGNVVQALQQRERGDGVGDDALSFHRGDVQAGKLSVGAGDVDAVATVDGQAEDRPLHPLPGPIVHLYHQRLASPELLPLPALAVQQPHPDDPNPAGAPPALVAAGLGHGLSSPGVLQVPAHHRLGSIIRHHAALVQPDSPVAEGPHRVGAVGNEEDRHPLPPQVVNPFQAFALEGLIPHRQHLVHQQNLRVGVDRDREAQPHIHPRGVMLHRDVYEPLQFGETDDVVQTAADLGPAQAQNGAVEVDVLPTGQVGVKARAQFQERPDAAAHRDPARGGLYHPRGQFQQGALPGAVGADDAHRLPLLHGETHIPQGPELLAGAVVAPEEPHDQFLEGTGALVVEDEFFGNPVKLYRRAQGEPLSLGWFSSPQAFAQFVQAPLYTVELGPLFRHLPKSPPAGGAEWGDSRHRG
jgi:hypothetical protein